MEKEVKFTQLVNSGSNIRREFIPTAVVSSEGNYPIGEFWDANKILSAIEHGEGGDVEELKALIRALQERVQVLEENAIMKGEIDTIGTEQIIDGSVNMEDLGSEVANKLKVDVDENDEHAIFGL